MIHRACVMSCSPDTLWPLSIWRKSKELVQTQASVLIKQDIYFVDSEWGWGVRVRWQCNNFELSLVEEKQHCNVTWTFLQLFKWTDFVTALSLSPALLWFRPNLGVRVWGKWEKEAITCSVRPVGLLFFLWITSFSEVAWFIPDYPGGSMDCQLRLSLQ